MSPQRGGARWLVLPPACSALGEGFKPAPPTVLCDCPQFGANKLLEQFFMGLDVSYINKITHFSLGIKGGGGIAHFVHL